MQSQIVLCVVQEISIAAPSDSTMFQEIRPSRPGVGHSCGLPDRRQAAAGLATNRECRHSGSACVHPSHLPQSSRASELEKMHPLWGFLQDSETAQANEQLEEQKRNERFETPKTSPHRVRYGRSASPMSARFTAASTCSCRDSRAPAPPRRRCSHARGMAIWCRWELCFRASAEADSRALTSKQHHSSGSRACEIDFPPALSLPSQRTSTRGR